MVWWLWKWRNNDVFNEEIKSMEQKITWIRKACKDVVTTFENIKCISGKRNLREVKLLTCLKPDADWVKFNVDGSRNVSTGEVGCGGVLRYGSGEWKISFVVNTGICSVEEAETWGVFYGMKLAWEKGYKKVIIESDSEKVVGWIAKEDNRKRIRGPIENIIDKCKEMTKQDWDVRISCVYREHNRTADCLARQAL